MTWWAKVIEREEKRIGMSNMKKIHSTVKNAPLSRGRQPLGEKKQIGDDTHTKKKTQKDKKWRGLGGQGKKNQEDV